MTFTIQINEEQRAIIEAALTAYQDKYLDNDTRYECGLLEDAIKELANMDDTEDMIYCLFA